MSTQPSSPPSSPLGLLVTNRPQVAIGLVVLGVVLGSLAVWWGVWGFARSGVPTDPAAADGKLIDEPKKEEPKAEDARPKKSPDYQIAAIWAGGVALLSLLSAVWVFTQPLDEGSPETAARKEVLAFGGTAGLLTAMAGGFLGYRWHSSLVQWISGGNAREAQWVLFAASIFLAGLIIMFLSLQLARTEQRTNAALRRVLYGFNSVFVGLLLLLVLVVVNVVSFLKVPNTLVTNDSAFTELSEESRRFLRALDRPAHAYLVMPETYTVVIGGRLQYDSLYADCRGLLSQCEDESRNFHAAYLSPAFDRERIASLMDRLRVKEADRGKFGLLVTSGEAEDTYTLIEAENLIEIEGRQLVFQGESKLITELMYLSDTQSKEKVYFTAGHGELKIDGFGGDEPAATNLVRYLRDRKMTVETLTIKDTDPSIRIPDDAAVVVVAGPRATIPAASPLQTALREFMNRPGKPGKLMAFLPAFPDATQKVAPTGLEGLLRDFGVDLAADQRLVTIPESIPAQGATGREVFAPPEFILVAPFRIQIDPLVRTFGRTPLLLENIRPVRPGPPGGAFRANNLMGTGILTWVEDSFATNPRDTVRRFEQDRDGTVLTEKQAREGGVPIAVAVTEEPTPGAKGEPRPRAVIFGSDTLIQDQTPIVVGREEHRQQVVSDCIDWLRERDTSIGIPPRKLGTFALEKPIEWSSQVVLLALVTVGITSLGLGVWLSRRR